LTESFSKFSPEIIDELSRVYPFHSTNLTARPLDAFISENPSIFDFNISPDWHQLVLYNGEEEHREMNISLNGNTASGALGLDPEESYYLYDFWNETCIGKFDGKDSVRQILQAGEARMVSVHRVQNNQQWISTDRHVMQGYVDLVEKPQWDAATKTLKGTSALIGEETYTVTIALNGYKPKEVEATGAEADITVRSDNPDLADLKLKVRVNQNLSWSISF